MILTMICFFKQKTAYEMRISDWSSDVCSSDLGGAVSSPVRNNTSNDLFIILFRMDEQNAAGTPRLAMPRHAVVWILDQGGGAGWAVAKHGQRPIRGDQE